MRALIPCMVLLAACPDPTRTDAGPGGAPGSPSSGPTPQGQSGGPGGHNNGFQVEAGKGVWLRGSFQYEGEKTGRNRIDFVTIQEGAPPNLVYAMTLEERGAWQVEVPKNFGKLHVLAFIDQAEDGPSPGDPSTPMGEPIVVGGQDIEGIDLVLRDTTPTPSPAPASGGPPPPPTDPGTPAGAATPGPATAPTEAAAPSTPTP